jgi:hypothetical protein
MAMTLISTAWKIQEQKVQPNDKKQKHPQAQNVITTMVTDSQPNFPIAGRIQPATRICFPQIPWLEKHGKITDFAQSMMADVTRHNTASRDKHELYQAMCHAIPFYLPAR